jgi:putative NADH-flavin reductase
MKVCVFGADGRTGLPLVEELISRGHEVHAFVYNEAGGKRVSEEADIFVGDVMNKEDVSAAVSEVDAVVSVLGHIPGGDPLMQTRGMENIISAMKENNISRILSLTGTGVRVSGDKPSLYDRLANFMVKKIDPERVHDGVEHARVLQESGLDWTILRVLKLSNKNSFSEAKLTKHGPAEWFTPRKKVAHILVSLLESGDFVGEMPVSS